MLAQELPKRAPVLFQRSGRVRDIAAVSTQRGLQKIMFEARDDARLDVLKRLVLLWRSFTRETEVVRLDSVRLGENARAGEDVAEFPHISWPGMTEERIERGERKFLWRCRGACRCLVEKITS